MKKVDVTIVGAGVVGLAVAAATAAEGREVYVLEKNETFGLETSSRNSGVIHSGIYYPRGSLKAKLCVAGNRMLYELCRSHGVGYKKTGKLIVAAGKDETAELKRLYEQGIDNGARGLRMISRKQLKSLEPNVEGVEAILCAETGIIDVHGLMKLYLGQAIEKGARIAYKTKVIAVKKADEGFCVSVADGGGRFHFGTRLLVNCGGLYSDGMAATAGVDIDAAGYRLHYCKGEYFIVGNGKERLVKKLIFPVPPPRVTGVGIHVTLDLDGRMRLGPSAEYVDAVDYSVDVNNRRTFYESVKDFLPFVEYDDLEPEMAGIRPKLQGPGEEIKDFVIREESGRGLPGLINLIGIESPGLTASPAIGEYVGEMVRGILS